ISSDKLHLGCGWKHVKGWLNCDVTGSDIDLDLASPPFPFADGQFSVIVAQQVVEHLDYDPVLLNLLRELHRILKPGGRVWLSCPDLEIICRSYCQDRCAAIDKGRKRHWPHGEEPGFPVQHRINYYFHHQGEHRNLYDLEMLEWALGYAGFKDVRRVDEGAFYREHPDFPVREMKETHDSLILTALR
ncbi:MAG TPA: methyltransferase domain-containing protein, partial [Candidatus Sulfopaludibacter sp.]|nr:methyltransferase domain-containing protein [Candidatus Sulfopaludibacter sp.]